MISHSQTQSGMDEFIKHIASHSEGVNTNGVGNVGRQTDVIMIIPKMPRNLGEVTSWSPVQGRVSSRETSK